MLKKLYDGWLEFWGRPGFYYTTQLKYEAKKRPWLYIVMALMFTGYFLWQILKAVGNRRVLWVIFALLSTIIITWLMLHVGGYW